MDRPLTGRVALVTGVSRAAGIAVTVARRLHERGATVHASGWPPHDEEMPWGAVPPADLPFAVHRHDLERRDTPRALVDEVVAAHGRIDIVVAAHARSSAGGLADVDAVELDRCWAVNVRSIVLLAQALGDRHVAAPREGPPVGRLLWFTSGQHRGPMDGEVAYAVSKGALHQMAATIDRALAPSRVIANCVNPGPVDTGYVDGAVHDEIAARFPDGRWGSPHDVANLVDFLVADTGAWIRGQVIDSEGGFSRC